MTILIPSYEPTSTLIHLIEDLRSATSADILIIDDGSGPDYKHYFSQAKSMGCQVLIHPLNMGKGQALKTGFKYLQTNSNSSAIVCADSDGQHSVEDILATAKLVDAKNPMVLGTRDFSDKSIPLRSRFGNKVSAKIFYLAAGYELNDTQTGLRAYSSALLPWLLSIPGDRFEYELNLLLHAKRDGISVTTNAIETIYEGDNGGSHFRPIFDSILVMAPLFKFILSSMTAGILDFALLFLFGAITHSLLASVVLARMISSVYNYTVNHRLVFKGHNESTARSAAKYFGLVLVIMSLNYLSIRSLVTLGVGEFLAKLSTEIMLFILSYGVQKLLVFHRKNHGPIASSFRRSPLKPLHLGAHK